MLIEFKFKNFRSFKDEQVFSLIASSGKNILSNTFETDALPKKKILRSSVIYGANASGKSNFIKAFDFVERIVRRSADVNPSSRLPLQKFALDSESKQQPSEFELTFVQKGVRYQYGFIVENNLVLEEWLIAYPKLAAQTWFERSWDKEKKEYTWYFGPFLKGEKNKLTPLTRENVLFLSIAAKFNHDQLSVIYEWFSRHLYTFELGESISSIEGLAYSIIEKDKEIRTQIRNLLKIADLGIDDFNLTKESMELRTSPKEGPEELVNAMEALRRYIENQAENTRIGLERFRVSMRHQGEHKQGEALYLPIDDESLGTKRLFLLSGIILASLNDGDVVVVDELDSSLHPLLVRTIVNLFNNPKTNPNNAQLVFNTHDTTLLDSAVFRRDQIWFTEKDRNGASHLYSLLDFSPRSTEAFGKGYLQGRYGAIPIIGNLEGIFTDGS